jgi:hypothetical protein
MPEEKLYDLFSLDYVALSQACSTFNRGIRKGTNDEIEVRDSPYVNGQKYPRKG